MKLLITIGLLSASNFFMLMAWYGNLDKLKDKPIYIVILISWGIAFLEYLLLVPANRIGYTTLNLAQLKILQECITLIVFIPFSLLIMNQPIKLDFLWAGFCILGAVYFIFRG